MCSNKTLSIGSYLKGPSSPYRVCLKLLNFLFPTKFHGPDIQLLHTLWVLQVARWNKIHHHIFVFCGLCKGYGHCFLHGNRFVP